MASVERRPLAAVITLGCKLNLADSEAIARRLGDAGFDVVDHVCEADAFVVNTCSITHVADQKSRRLIRSVRRVAPGAAVTVTGCFPRTAGNDAVVALGADFVAGTRDCDQQALVSYIVGRRSGSSPRGAAARLHTRAFIKAQEGCNDVCAFCIVPRTRGREVSRAVEVVAAEVEDAAKRGAQEAVITGTQLGAWGRDCHPPLAPKDLIAGVLAGSDIPRIRFSSLQPQDITPELLALWQDPRLMPHFHLALQSGSDTVLQAMRRRYTVADYRRAVALIRTMVPGAAITTDVIVGFPGERDADFEATLELCQEVGFARVHAFPYSPRHGTTAARMPGQVAATTKQERMRRLLALSAELARAFAARHTGSLRPVLWEEVRQVEGERLWSGHTDDYLTVYASGDDLANRITSARLGGPFRDGVRAEVVVTR